MKNFLPQFLFVLVCFVFSGFAKPTLQEEVEFVCIKTHKASNICYYNFKVGGMPFHYKDMGCKRKRDAVIKDANEGSLALSKDWKLPCPEVKKEEKPGL